MPKCINKQLLAVRTSKTNFANFLSLEGKLQAGEAITSECRECIFTLLDYIHERHGLDACRMKVDYRVEIAELELLMMMQKF